MPPTAAALRVGRYLLSLVLILIVLFGLVFLPGHRHTPKLGLDLEGGAQVILQAATDNGKIPSKSSMKVARQILTQRVNGAGVSAAEVVQEGDDRIVISVPGKSAAELAEIGKAAVLNFRPLVMPGVPGTTTTVPTSAATGGTTGSVSSGTGTPSTSGATTGSATPATSAGTPPKSAETSPSASSTGSPGASPTSNGIIEPQGLLRPLAAAATTTPAKTTPAKTTPAKTTPAKTTPAKTTPAKTTAAPPSATPTAAAAPLSQNPFTKLTFPLPTSDTQFNALTTTQQSELAAALENFKCGSKPTDNPKADLAACDVSGSPKYLLGPVIVPGQQISNAAAVAPSSNSFGWSISIDLKSSGQTAWANYTAAHHSSDSTADPTTCSATGTPCAEFVAFTLDGDVISAPHNEATINGTTSVTGQYTQASANQLANQLKYGALPLSFKTLTTQDVTATLGTSQLKAGLLAGGIGLALVVLYSLLYYRGLGFVTIASLVVSGTLTYACLVILGREIGFTLTLAGIAGFIVAVGITADSFVVFFERLKDEVHSGRSIRVAVPRAWSRARRTILSADTVSFLAAAVLYYFAAGDVRGFAFTLGLSTILDLVVVFLFTHPIVSLLSRSRAFGSPRFTGLNSVTVGGVGLAGAAASDATGRGPQRRAGRGGGSTSTAVLEPATADTVSIDPADETLADDTPADDTLAGETLAEDRHADELTVRGDTDARPAVAPTFDSEPATDSGAPRSRRITRRPAPPAEIGEDAAVRAARRRGRTVRPPAPPRPVLGEPDDGPDEDRGPEGDRGPDGGGSTEVDRIDADIAADAAADNAPADNAPADDGSASAELTDDRAEAGFGARPRSSPARSGPAGSGPGATTAAERAAARRARNRPGAATPVTAPIPPEPSAPGRSAPGPSAPELAASAPIRPERDPVESSSTALSSTALSSTEPPPPEPTTPEPPPTEPTTPEPTTPEAPTPEPPTTTQPPEPLSGAAARAQLRRARIRARGDRPATPPAADGTDGHPGTATDSDTEGGT